MYFLKGVSRAGITLYLDVHNAFLFLVYSIECQRERKKKIEAGFLPWFQLSGTVTLLM